MIYFIRTKDLVICTNWRNNVSLTEQWTLWFILWAYENIDYFRVTDESGRTDHSIIPPELFATAEGDVIYKLQMDLEAYYIDCVDMLFPQPEIVFRVDQHRNQYHFDLEMTITPYSYSVHFNVTLIKWILSKYWVNKIVFFPCYSVILNIKYILYNI